MSYNNWESSLLTRAINKTLKCEPKHPARRKSIKQSDTVRSAVTIKKQ